MRARTTGGLPHAVLAWLTPGRAFWIAAGLYALVTGYGVLNDGYHSDDWRHLAGVSPLWTAVEGRWLLEVIYRDLLGERFLLPVQLVLAFPLLYWTALTIARHASRAETVAAATVAIFLVGTQHVFMTDVLSFASNVFAYPLALALSVAGYELIWRSREKPARHQVQAALLGAQALAFSIAIYQTFAVAGLIVPVLALLRADRVSFRAAARLALIGALASVLAIGLYLVEWRLYASATGVTIVSERFQATDAAGLGAKLGALPGLMRGIHTGSIMALPFSLRAVLGLFSLAALALFAVAGIGGMLSGGARAAGMVAVLRFATGAGLAFFVFPILFWLGYEGDSPPPRAFGYIGYWTAGIFVAGVTLSLAGSGARLRMVLAAASSTGLAAISLILLLAASANWSDNARVGQRDLELARAINARIAALPGYSGPPFRLVGGVSYDDLSWGSLAGWSSFHPGNPNIGIFRQIYGYEMPAVSLPVSPRRCPAFPAEDAAFLHEGTAYLCLSASEPYTDSLRCAPLAAATDESICLGATAFVHIGKTCLGTGENDPELRVAFRVAGQSRAVERSFSVASFAIPMSGYCHTVALAPRQKALEALELRMLSPDGSLLWDERIATETLAPWRAGP